MFEITRIRRKLLHEAEGDARRQKALAFLLCLRHHLGGRGSVPAYSRNKLHKLTGASDGTVKKYMGILTAWGLARFETERDGSRTLRFTRLSSGTSHRNIKCDGLDWRSLQRAFESVRHLMHIMVISNKRFIEQAIRVRNNPRTLAKRMKREDFKKARALCKSYARPDANGSYTYDDWGMSYKTIAKRLGCCERTAFTYIDKGVRAHRFKREHHYEWVSLPYLTAEEIRRVGGYTFTMDGWGVRVKANTYANTRSWERKTSRYHELLVGLTRDEYQEYMRTKAERRLAWLQGRAYSSRRAS